MKHSIKILHSTDYANAIVGEYGELNQVDKQTLYNEVFNDCMAEDLNTLESLIDNLDHSIAHGNAQEYYVDFVAELVA